jgi:manganese transport protein
MSSPSPAAPKDPYQFHTEDVAEPPKTLGAILRRIGPGMILAASIVGSGELIATTTLGAEVGYVALWVILLSCFIKPAIQAEIGRYTIASGETGLEAYNRVPGPRFKVNWVVWAWAAMVMLSLLQVGAMYGGVAQVANLIFPAIPINFWVVVFMGVTLAVLLGGGYARVEFGAVLLVGLFTLLTFLCAMVLVGRPEYFSMASFKEGLTFQLPAGGLASAVAVFGITGVGASELFMYPYWCVEKGYARFAGRRDGSADWQRRARGWVKVMHVDIYASMVVYTISTVGFYFLGAGVLHSQGLVPDALNMIQILSNMFTQTLGEWALWLFYFGAVAVLYSTIFAATAAHSRLFADLASMIGMYRRDDYASRVRYQRNLVVLLTLIPVSFYYLFQSPVLMVKAGGVAQSAMLPVIAVGALFLRHRRLPSEVAPSRGVTVLFWIASAAIILLMAYYAVLIARP